MIPFFGRFLLIMLLGTGQPRYARPRRLPPDRLAMAEEEFRVMCQQGLCRPSKSAWASPLHIGRKSNGEWRYCGDYRALNATTVPDRFPIPYMLGRSDSNSRYLCGDCYARPNYRLDSTFWCAV